MFGISGPSALIIAWGLRRLWLRWRRRRNEKTDPGRSEKGEVAKRPLDDGYARQLAEVYALSGRSPIADATLGRVYDEELKQATTSSDGAIAAFARSVRDRVAEKFYRIHDRNPLPAEPIEQH
jgi:hypothetical protein